MQEQSFFRGALQTYGEDWIRFNQNEKNSLIKHFLQFKKNLKIVYKFFPDLISIFQTCSRSEQISRLFQEFKTLCEPWIKSNKLWRVKKLRKEDKKEKKTHVPFPNNLSHQSYSWRLFTCTPRAELDRGQKEVLSESLQVFEVAAARSSRLVNLVFSRQTGFSSASIRLLKKGWSQLSPLNQAHGY